MKGWSELSLLAAVLVACWVRTPVGAALTGAVALARHQPTPDLLASFRTALPAEVERSLVTALVQGPTPGNTDPELPGEGAWSAAVRTAVSAHLGPEVLVQVEGLGEADPAAALEIWAVGREARDRAVRRARASGSTVPEALSAHRRFLGDEDAAAADRAVEDTLALATVLDLAWPVSPAAPLTSGFGYRQHPVLHTRKLHEGVDIAVPEGTEVHAAGAGRVARARFDGVNGNHVTIDHGHGVTTAYCHGSVLRIDKGTSVTRGTLLMDSGSTGRSTGPHLHFGLRIGGRPVDPAPFRARGAAEVLARIGPA